jgi:DeoR family glycerol-3-phosphate regulon repressor
LKASSVPLAPPVIAERHKQKLGSRRHAILDAVRRRGSCSLAELAADLEVSTETVRRDILPLVQQGLLDKVHGGVKWPDRKDEPPIQQRLVENMEAKRAIAEALAREIADGEAVMLDMGSTTLYAAQALRGHAGLTVVTNSPDIGRALTDGEGNRVYLAGGEMRGDDGAIFGPSALAFVRQFTANTAILSVGGMDADIGIMDRQLWEAELARAYIAQSERTIVVADRTKFGQRSLVRICGFDQVDVLITDSEPPADFLKQLRDAKVRVIVASA